MVQCDQRKDEEEQENECLSIGQIKRATNKPDREKINRPRRKRFLFPVLANFFFFSRDIVNNIF
jgi:hypothetical protein